MARSKLTVQRDLRTARSVWAATPRISVPAKPVPRSRTYDIIIVGAGISGALMAQALINGKRSVAVLDRREPVRGSSMASTAMIQHEIDIPLFKLARSIGIANAARAWRRSVEAVESLQRLADDLDIDCQMGAKSALYLAGDAYGARALLQETTVRKKAGLDAQYLTSADLKAEYGLNRTAAIRSSAAASANPAQLTAGILNLARNTGCEIISPIEVTDLHAANGQVILATSTGHLLVAEHVVFCTGYEFLKPLADRNHQVISTWAIASKPDLRLPGWLSSHLIWEASDPYLYLRMTSTGRLIAGGEDEDSADAYLSPAKVQSKARTIARKVGDLFGCSIGDPDYAWAAGFGATPTGLPMIGEVPGLKNVYAVMGYGGNGITFSKMAAEIVSAAILGKPDKDADLFPFSSR